MDTATSSDFAVSVRYSVIAGRGPSFYALLAVLVAFVAAGLAAAHQMETQGHYITGMNNQIVWGIPHVFAVFMIVTASGALNGASLSSVLGRSLYTPYARLSGLLAIALLLGGLAVITLDLGRPERLVVALTHFNMKSVFAWNVFFYTGFLALTGFYLWTLMERRMNRLTKPVGGVLLIWRLTLTTATGLIFGVLVAREAYDAALMAPMFIAMSLSFGSAAYLLLLLTVFGTGGRVMDDAVVHDFKRLLAAFVVVALYFVIVFHAVKLYSADSRAVERFLLADGGVITVLFWVGQIGIGSLVPLWLLLWRPTAELRPCIATACALVLLGGVVQIYVIIIGGQAYPLDMFPGREIIESSFFDGAIAHYQPRLPEFLLAFGGVAFAILLVVLGMRILPFVPKTRGAD